MVGWLSLVLIPGGKMVLSSNNNMMGTPENILKKHGLRITSFRNEVVQLFLDSSHALSNQDIEQSLGNPDRITLYRTLKNFEEKGIIHRAVDGTTTSKYALCESDCSEHKHQDEHVHFYCERCNNTFCVDEVEVPQVQLPEGYVVTATSMVIQGVCKSCKEKDN